MRKRTLSEEMRLKSPVLNLSSSLGSGLDSDSGLSVVLASAGFVVEAIVERKEGVGGGNGSAKVL